HNCTSVGCWNGCEDKRPLDYCSLTTARLLRSLTSRQRCSLMRKGASLSRPALFHHRSSRTSSTASPAHFALVSDSPTTTSVRTAHTQRNACSDRGYDSVSCP